MTFFDLIITTNYYAFILKTTESIDRFNQNLQNSIICKRLIVLLSEGTIILDRCFVLSIRIMYKRIIFIPFG